MPIYYVLQSYWFLQYNNIVNIVFVNNKEWDDNAKKW
jgi:hypothetical protein